MVLSFSQTPISFNLTDTLPLYKEIIYGKLDNGLTYYILRNEKPQNRAFLQLAVNAGSVFEDDDQKGLAHMCEHMAFNGTKNFPKKELINFLESIGMKFGAELNAYTSFDETVYMLEVPLDKEEYLKKGLLVLHDWANAVSYEDQEIINERGVIFEEWRLGRGPENRLQQKTFPVMFYGSKYAERLPIGDTAVFKYCPPENLRRFYHDWYRPDLQALVIVGDFDAKQVENFVKEIFSQIPKREQVRPHLYPEIPDHNDLKAVVATDPQARYTLIQYIIKLPTKPVLTYADYRKSIINQLISTIMRQRFSEIANDSKSAFSMAYSYYTNYVGMMDMFGVYTLPKKGKELDAVKTISVEMARVRQFGFTASELKLAKEGLLSIIKKQYDERNKMKSEDWASMLQQNFSQYRTPQPGLDVEYELYQKFLPQISLEELNNEAKQVFIEKNNVIAITASEIQLPSENDIIAAFNNIDKSLVVPYEDKAIATNLISNKIKAGKVAKVETDNITNSQIWTLKNGIKVVLKQTDFKDNEIQLRAYSQGGYTLYELNDNINARTCSEITTNSGLGDFKQDDLEKFLSSKNIELTPYIKEFSEGFYGTSTKEDFETMMQMIYLYFTAPRFDEDAFNSYIEKQKSILDNKSNNPNSLWREQIGKTLNNNSKYTQPIDIKDLQQINNKRAQEIFKERFSDPASFTFVIVGNIDFNTAKPIIEKYLGSLPAKNNNEKPNYRDIKLTNETRTDVVKSGSDQKSLVITSLQSFEPNNIENKIYLTAISYILGDSLIDQIREQKQWTYSISAFPSYVSEPQEAQYLTVFYSCKPERVDSINYEIVKIAKSLTITKIAQEELDKTIQKLKRQRELNMKENDYWMSNLYTMHIYNKKPDFVTEYDKIVNGITAESIKQYAQKFIKGTYLSIALKPVE